MSDLTTGAIRAVIKAVIPDFVNAGFSFNRFAKYMRDLHGFAYRRADMLSDWNKTAGLMRNKDLFEDVSYFDEIPSRDMASVQFTRPRRFRWFGEATYTDQTTGESVKKWVSGYSNTDPFKSLWESEFMEQWGETEEYKGMVIEGVNIVGAWRNSQWP